METELGLKDYLLIFKRRWRQVVTFAAISFAIILIAIIFVKVPTYSSKALILIEKPHSIYIIIVCMVDNARMPSHALNKNVIMHISWEPSCYLC